ncbi:hypothetical protein C8R42DRAFT_727050 [Lentinula raphanica]|nr:hypothetical protein C8R42DRAFT_727050 [Lentinula raphanica]
MYFHLDRPLCLRVRSSSQPSLVLRLTSIVDTLVCTRIYNLAYLLPSASSVVVPTYFRPPAPRTFRMNPSKLRTTFFSLFTMRLPITCSLLAAVLLGVISVTASPFPSHSHHPLQKRAPGHVFWLGLVSGDQPLEYKLASNSMREQSHFCLRLGNIGAIIFRGGGETQQLEIPVTDKEKTRHILESYISSGLVLLGNRSERLRAQLGVHLANAATLSTPIHPEISQKLQEISFSNELGAHDSTEAPVGALDVFGVILYFVDKDLLKIEAVLEKIPFIVATMNELKHPGSGSAA